MRQCFKKKKENTGGASELYGIQVLGDIIDLAQYLEARLGKQSGYARSTTEREGAEQTQGQSEQAIPLLTAQEIMQLNDEDVLCFHRHKPPFKVNRMDWRQHPGLVQKRNRERPQLAPLPPLADLPEHMRQSVLCVKGYIDSNMRN